LYNDAPNESKEIVTLRFHNLSRNLLSSSYMVQVYLRTPQEEDFKLDDLHYAGTRQ